MMHAPVCIESGVAKLDRSAIRHVKRTYGDDVIHYFFDARYSSQTNVSCIGVAGSRRASGGSLDSGMVGIT